MIIANARGSPRVAAARCYAATFTRSEPARPARRGGLDRNVTERRFLTDQTAVVTGASAGIGRAIAARLAAEGANVVLAARREERLVALAEEINRAAAGGRALPVAADLTREEDIVRLAEIARRELGGVDILVNNAGHGYFAAVTKIDAARLDEIMKVNFVAAVLCTKYLLPDMLERKSGAIINVGSVSGKRGWAGGTPYVASKFALRGFAECLWAEVKSSNVRVINLYPTYVASDFFEVARVRFPNLDQVLTPETLAEVVIGALRLPGNANVLELDLALTNA